MGWAFVASLRYQAKADEVIGALPPVVSASGVVAGGGQWHARNEQLTFTNPYLTISCKAKPIGERFELERNVFRASSIATYVAEARHVSLAEQRLWRWAPGRRLIAKLISDTLLRVGAESSIDGWLSLPRTLHTLLEEASADIGVLTDRRVRDLAGLIGDAEIAAPLDEEAIGLVWRQHAAWIQSFVDRGDSAVCEALASLTRGASLARACDRLVARSSDLTGLREIVQTLRAHPECPPSRVLRRLVVNAIPGERAWHDVVAVVAPYLLERNVDRKTSIEKLAAMAEVATMTSDQGDPPFDAELLLSLSEHAPDVALKIIRRGLVARERTIVCNAAALLITIGDPWCRELLIDALGDSPQHRGVLDDALASLTHPSSEPAGVLREAVESWSSRLRLQPIAPLKRPS